MIQLYMCICSFFSLFHYGLSQDIEYNSVQYSKTLLFIHSIYKNLYLLTPTAYSIPLLAPSLLATTSLFR